VIGVWGTAGKYKYLLDIYREQVGFTKTKAQIKVFILKYRRIAETIIEAKANGEAIIDSMKEDKEITVPIYGYSPTDSKAARLSSVLPEFESGLVLIPDTNDQRYSHMAEVVEKYLTELTTFPKAKHDDCVDMTTQFLLRFRESNFAWLDYVDDEEIKSSDEFEDLAERMGWKPRGIGLGF
jgi:predicted phage terminase large subunit-like protein